MGKSDVEKCVLSDKMLAYVIGMDGSADGGGWLKQAAINPSIAHSILSYNTNNHRAGVDNYVCKELPLDTPVEDIRKIMEKDRNMLVIGGTQDHQNWKENVSPCINSASGMGGGHTPLVMEEPKVNVVGNYNESGHDASRIVDSNGVAPAVRENHGTVTAVLEEPKCNVVGELDYATIEMHKRAYGTDGLSPSLSAGMGEGGGTIPKVLSEKKIGNLYGATGGNFAGNVYDDTGLAPSISTCGGGNQQPMIPSKYRIRKLTARECWRLMAFTDEEFDKAEKVNSNTNLYKQAGNSIVVDVLAALFQEIINADGTINDHKGEQINLFDLL